jgi:hypothetical protein
VEVVEGASAPALRARQRGGVVVRVEGRGRGKPEWVGQARQGGGHAAHAGEGRAEGAGSPWLACRREWVRVEAGEVGHHEGGAAGVTEMV